MRAGSIMKKQLYTVNLHWKWLHKIYLSQNEKWWSKENLQDPPKGAVHWLPGTDYQPFGDKLVNCLRTIADWVGFFVTVSMIWLPMGFKKQILKPVDDQYCNYTIHMNKSRVWPKSCYVPKSMCCANRAVAVTNVKYGCRGLLGKEVSFRENTEQCTDHEVMQPYCNDA